MPQNTTSSSEYISEENKVSKQGTKLPQYIAAISDLETMTGNGINTEKSSPKAKEINEQGKKLPQYIAAIAVCLGALAAGPTLGWTANITEELKNGEFNGIEITESNLGWVASLVPLGAMVMCVPIGVMCDVFGRKLALLLFTIPFMGGWLLIIFANSLVMLYIGRFITGMAGGAFCVAAPLYTTEIAEKEIRGVLGSYFQLFLTFGNLFSNTMAYALPIKIFTIVVAVLPLIFAAAFIFQPETPVYRMKQKRETEARAALVRLRGSSYNVDKELQEIKANLEHEERNKISFMESIKKRSTKKAAIVCFSLMFFQQAGGVNAILFYTSDIFKSSGANLDEKLSTIIVGVISVTSVFISSLVVDKLGRRILLLISDFFMAVGLIIIGIFFTLKERNLVNEDTLSALGFMPLLGLSIFNIVFALGYGPIPWIMSAELFPTEIKSVASAAAGTFNWFIGFIMTKFYLDLKLAVGGDTTFYIFSSISLIGTVFVFFVVPETKNKSMEQIQRELNGEKTSEIKNKN